MNLGVGIWALLVTALWIATPRLLGWKEHLGICGWYLFTWFIPLTLILAVIPGALK